MPKIKKIALILPRGKVYKYKTGAFGVFIRYAPLTFPTLISYTPKSMNIEYEIFDEGVESFRKEDINADLIGITAITGTSQRAYIYADYFRSKGLPVILGGVHTTLMPEEAMEHADSIVTGLAVHTWPQLLHDFQNGKLKKRYDNFTEVNYSNWPIPARNYYKDKKRRFISINSLQATYGCPNRCEFCVTPYYCPGYKQRPVQDVINEIRQIKSKYIVFVDPSPVENKGIAKKLYKEMIPLKKWVSPSTIRIVEDDELLELATRSGCKGLLIGFESVTDQALLGIKKGFNSKSKFFNAAQKFHKNGIAIMGCFVFGLDGDDNGVFKRTINFVNEANIDLPRFTVNTPFPSTPFYKKMKKENRIIKNDWSLYDCQHVVIKPKLMSAEELQKGLFWAWREAYRPTSIIKRLAKSRSFLGVSMLTNFAYWMYGRNLPRFSEKTMLDNTDI